MVFFSKKSCKKEEKRVLRLRRRRGGLVIEGAFATLIFVGIMLTLMDYSFGFLLSAGQERAAWKAANALNLTGSASVAKATARANLFTFQGLSTSYTLEGWGSINELGMDEYAFEMGVDDTVPQFQPVSFQMSSTWKWISPVPYFMSGDGMSMSSRYDFIKR